MREEEALGKAGCRSTRAATQLAGHRVRSTTSTPRQAARLLLREIRPPARGLSLISVRSTPRRPNALQKCQRDRDAGVGEEMAAAGASGQHAEEATERHAPWVATAALSDAHHGSPPRRRIP